MSEEKCSLKVNLEDLQDAFESSFDTLWYFLDVQTGEVVLVSDDTRQQLEALLEATDATTIDVIHAAITDDDGPDWEKDALYSAALVEFDNNRRFIEIPRTDSRQAYGDMEAFIETVSNRHI